MATTISSGRGNSPKLAADVASRAEVNGGRGITFDGASDKLTLSTSLLDNPNVGAISVWVNTTAISTYNWGTTYWGNQCIISKGNILFAMTLDHNKAVKIGVYNGSATNLITTPNDSISVGSWNHIVYTWNADVNKIYINGENQTLSYTLNATTTLADISSGGVGEPCSISSHASNTGFFNGSMSDFKIFLTSSILTDSQVQELYLKPEQSAPSAIQDNLVAWYPMCEGLAQSVAYDHSGNNNHAVEGGGSSYTLAVAQNEPLIPQIPLVKYNEKMLLDGDGSKSVVLAGGIPAFGTKPFTVSAFYMPSVNSTAWDYILHNSASNGTNGFVLAVYVSTGKLLGGDWANASVVSDSASSVQNEPMHIVYSRTGTGSNETHIYKNGVKIKSGTDTDNYTASATAKIGASGGGATQPSSGIIDELSVWNHGMTDAEVSELFANSVIKDATTHSKSGNLLSYHRNDGVTTWKDRRGWSYLDFDSTDYIDCGTAIGNSLGDGYSNDLTVSLWFRLASTGTSRGLFTIGAFGGSGGEVYLAYFGYGALVFRLNDSGWTKTVTGFTDLGWNHMAVVYDASSEANSKLYLNGSSVGSASGTFPSSLDLNGLKTIIGAVESNAWNWEGGMKSVGLYNVTKSEPEIQAIYNAGINSSEVSNSGIINYWELDNASTVKDLVGSSDGTPSGTLVLNDGNTGTVGGTPDSITIREGLTSGKDGLNFPLKDSTGNMLRLNGVDEYLEIPDNKVFSFGDSSGDLPFSIEAWLKPNDVTGFAIISKGIYNTNAEYILWINHLNKLSFELYDESVNNNYILANYNSSLASYEGSWFHVCATYDGRGGSSANAGIKLYINGSNVATTLDNSGTYVSMENLNANVHVGRYDSYYADGLIDECRIYNKELSLPEIQKNYKHQKGKHKND